MTDVTPNLALPELIAAQAQKHVTVNEALRALDALVQLAVLDRDLASPPSEPIDGTRWIVAAGASGDWAAHEGDIAAWQDGGWSFYAPQAGWLAYVIDEDALVAWNGDTWAAASSSGGGSSMAMLGIGTSADEDNPFSAKLNNTLWVARTVAEGGDGTLRYKMSKESADKTLSMLFQDDFSGRAEVGLTGDDDFHFKVSPDGTSWIDAMLLDKASGAAKINAGFFLTGDLTAAEITADQNDYNPDGLAGASILRLSADAERTLTGLSGGGHGRVLTLLNAGEETITLSDESTSSSAANRFGFGADIPLAARQSAVLWYDGTDGRWTLVAGPPAASTFGGGGGGDAGPADLDLLLAQLAMGQADALNAALFVGENGNRFADSFDTLAFVDVSASSGVDTTTAGQLGPSTDDVTETSSASNNVTAISTGYTTMNRQWGIDNNKTVKSIGIYSTAAQDYVIKLFKRAASGQYDVVYSQSGCSHPGGSGYVDFPLTSPYAIPDDGASYYAGHYTTGAKPNATTSGEAIAFKMGNITGTAQSGFTENTIGAPVIRVTYQGPPSDAVIVSEALSAETAPNTATLVARITYIDAITPGTDLIFEVSRDDGTTWAEVDMTEKFTIGAVRILEGAETSLAAQPSGSDMRWRVSSDNNKRFALNDIYFYWT